VKKRLKSVYIYRSYYKNKLGGPFFWNTLYVKFPHSLTPCESTANRVDQNVEISRQQKR